MKLTLTELLCSDETRQRFLKILIFAMRTSIFYMAFAIFSMQFLLANHDGKGQGIDSIYVTVEMEGQDMKTLLKKIESQTDLRFLFLNESVDNFGGIYFPKVEWSVKRVLDYVISKEPSLTYEQIDINYIIIKRKVKNNALQNDQDQNNHQKPANIESAYTISGTVTDAASKTPLPGVNVLVKGTTRGTTTDSDGKYVINVENSDLLVFSFVGYEPYETQVGQRTVLNVEMKQDIANLKEVVINAGYYTVTDKTKTGNIVRISARDIERQPVSSPLMALQGRVAGLDITPITGVAGGAPRVEIRGRNSIRYDGGNPLYVIDGIPIDSNPLESNNSNLLKNSGFDPLSSINPANIESIEILKDADATALYGSRGANGVILITTKGAIESGTTTLNARAYSGFGQVSNFVDLLNTPQYIEMRKEAYSNAGQTPSGGGAVDLLVWDTTRYTNWQKELLGGTTTVSDIQLNLTGGNRELSFRLGGSYHTEGMVFPGDFGFKRITGNLSLNHLSSNGKFRAIVSANYGSEINNLFTATDLVAVSLSLEPNAPKLYDEDGNLNWENSTWVNPLSALKSTDNSTGDNLIINSKLAYEALPGLELKINLGYSIANRNSVVKFPLSSRDPSKIFPTTTARSNFGFNHRRNWIIEPQANFSKYFKLHNLNLTLGTTWQRSQSSYQLVEAEGYTSDILLNSLRGATNTRYLNDGDSDYRYAALFARIGYGWKEKYLLNITGRRDGSSRFGPGKRYANFGAIGLAWVFSKEQFIQNNTPLLSHGKLRASYGITGNDQIGDYQFLSTYGYTLYNYQNKVSLTPQGLNNPDYAWEVTKKLEAAIELSFLKDNLSFEIAWYQNRSSNQLLSYPLPGTTGFPSVVSNMDATVENRGWEVLIRSNNINKENFQWSSSFNLSIPKNKLVSYPNIENSSFANTYVVGESLYINKVYNYLGVNPETGYYDVEDVNDDGAINNDDRKYIQEVGRVYYGGLNNSIRYKWFELSFLLQFSKQIKSVLIPSTQSKGNQPVEILNRWQNPGDIAKYQMFSTNFSSFAPTNNARNSNAAYEDSSFIRLKTLSISFQLPSALISKIKLSDCRIYLQGQNLFTLTDYRLLDPETGNFLPPLRMITCGIEIKL